MIKRSFARLAILAIVILASAQVPPPPPAITRIPPHVVFGPFGGTIGWVPPTSSTATTDADLAMNSPDNFAWILFARINKLAPTQPVVNGHTLNNALWETWADDDLTYGNPSMSHPPQWPAGGITVPAERSIIPFNPLLIPLKRLRPPVKRQIFEIQRQLTPIARSTAISHVPELILSSGAVEETRRNKQTFDFIIQHHLYYRQGLVAAFSNAAPIQFPRTSIEVKAHWKQITAADKPHYHWNYDANGTLYGLIALHIISKTVPNWTWATFEHVDNPRRCDVLGCFDDFGFTPSAIQPGGPYPAGTITAGLTALFTQEGIAPEFRNYRLKGAQVDFIDPTGRPTKLGNSEIEGGFLAQSSCMTCHASASFNVSGQINVMQTAVGPPNPNWFWDTNMTTMLYKQHDFVWGIFAVQPGTP